MESILLESDTRNKKFDLNQGLIWDNFFYFKLAIKIRIDEVI